MLHARVQHLFHLFGSFCLPHTHTHTHTPAAALITVNRQPTFHPRKTLSGNFALPSPSQFDDRYLCDAKYGRESLDPRVLDQYTRTGNVRARPEPRVTRCSKCGRKTPRVADWRVTCVLCRTSILVASRLVDLSRSSLKHSDLLPGHHCKAGILRGRQERELCVARNVVVHCRSQPTSAD